MDRQETQARLEARLPASIYATLKRAAQLKGRTVSDFVVNAAYEAAQRAIEEDNLIRLSLEDQQRFVSALISPPPPNEALRLAARRHAATVDMR